MKKTCFIFSLLLSMIAFAFISCTSEDMDVENDNVLKTKAVAAETNIKKVAYIEVNDNNPLNAGSYYMDNKAFYDIVIIFAANIRGVGNKAVLHCNENIKAILDNKEKYIKHLQNKGIKVLLSILGDHTGLGVANMDDKQINAFAAQLAETVKTYELDGIDFDDEYAEYGRNKYPYANRTSYSALINKLRSILPADKLITVYDWGYSRTLSSTARDNINYAWYGVYGAGSFGSSYIAGLPNNKWSAQALNLKSNNNTTIVRTMSAQSKSMGMGAIMTYNLGSANVVNVLNAIGQGAFNQTVTFNGETFNKDW